MPARSIIRCAGRPRGLAVPDGCARARSGRRRRARAGDVAREPAAAPAGHARRSAARRRRGLGSDALLDFQMEVTLDGETLTRRRDQHAARRHPTGLHFVRGRWVEVDRERLRAHARPVSRRSSRRRRRRGPVVRRGDAPASPARRSPSDATAGRRRRRLVARSSPVRGWPSTLDGLRRPGRRCATSIPARTLQGDAAALSAGGRALAALLSRSASAPAWPTTWDSARRCRCWRCCWSLQEQERGRGRGQPARRAGVAARQLGGGDRALRAGLRPLVAHPSADAGRDAAIGRTARRSRTSTS